MRLESGARLGPYEVRGPLGAGGMGEVYRARDARLARDVALKVLPADLAGDAERLSRFGREAQVLASLNHPGIAAIYGIEEAGDLKALVLELVEGPTLLERLAAGALPIDEAIAAAAAIAAALEAAHDQGIIHRDLKPANIKLRPDGAVKVLDFGLAKALEPATTGGVDMTHSPTITARATRAGIILGTAAYMAPEQAKGKAVDRRADIWAYGVVLYEMLSGRRLFDGETPSEVLAAVILKDPDMSALPASTPAHVRHLLARCLEKDPKQRLRDIGEARLALAEPRTSAFPGTVSGTGAAAGVVAATGTGAAAGRDRRRGRAGPTAWIAAALGVALLAALALLARGLGGGAAPVARYDVQPPPKAALDLINRPALAISHDGSMLAYAATVDGIARLYVRARDEGESRPLPGTDGASNPVFSPDDRWIAFFAGNLLKKTSLDGTVIALAPVNDARGVSWAGDRSLVYTGEAIGPVQTISADGGTPRPVTSVDTAGGERSHRWPEALPGGKTVLFTVGTIASPDNYDASAIDAVDIASGARRTVLEGAAMARYVPPGYLVFARAGVLHAVVFDADRAATRGRPVPVVRGVAGDTPTGAAHFSCSDGGTLAYVPGSNQSGRLLAWVGRDGTVKPVDLPVAIYNDLRVSPDGARAVVAVGYSGSADIWVYDFNRRTFTRLTFDAINATPIWSGDGSSVLYASIDASVNRTIVRKVPVDGSRTPETVAEFPTRVFLGGGPRDGRALILAYGNLTEGGKTDILRLAFEPGARPVTISATRFDEYTPAASPDGRWVAYQSDDTGRGEIYVRDASGSGGRWQVSTAGGEEPVWSADGRELFYRSEARLMAVPTAPGPRFEMGVPRALFDGVYRMRSDTGLSFDVDPKGGRFLMIRAAGEEDANAPIRVVLNWIDEARRLVAERH